MLIKPNHPDFSSVGRAFDCRCLKSNQIVACSIQASRIIFYLIRIFEILIKLYYFHQVHDIQRQNP